MQYLTRLYAVLLIAFILLGCSTEAPVSADLAGSETALTKKSDDDDDDCGCGKIKAKLLATGQINPPLLTATGEMRGDLKGTVNYVANLADIVPMTSTAGNDPVNPSASLLGTWTLTTKEGVLTFRDVGAFEQVPNGIGTSFSTVIGGTGCYAGASGFLFISFVADETGLTFEEEHRGEIFCQKHGEDDDEDEEVSRADVVAFQPAGEVGGGVLLPGTSFPPTKRGESKLRRDDDELSYKIRTTGLPPGAYTNWWVIVNNPEQCDGLCDEADIFDNPATNSSVFWATGDIVKDDGVGKFEAKIKEGQPSKGPDGFILGNGLVSAEKAEVHIIIKYHGPASDDADVLYEQTHTLLGSCDSGANAVDLGPPFGVQCFDPQVAIHRQ